MEKLVQYLNFSYKSTLKKARRLMNDGVEPEAITNYENIITAIVKNHSVCLNEDGFSCGCTAGRSGRLCYHIIFLILYMRDNNYEIPEKIIEKVINIVESWHR